MEKERVKAEAAALADLRGIARNPSLSTINEERSSQISMYESAVSEASGLDDERADVSVSIDGKEISLSLYDTPDISEAEAKQIAEIYAEEISDHISGKRSMKALCDMCCLMSPGHEECKSECLPGLCCSRLRAVSPHITDRVWVDHSLNSLFASAPAEAVPPEALGACCCCGL